MQFIYIKQEEQREAGKRYSLRKFTINNTAQQQKMFSLVPWFLGLFLGLFGALIQKMTFDRPHQL